MSRLDVLGKKYQKILDIAWVCSFRDEQCSVFSWCLSRTKPKPVINPSMSWRKPTFEEYVARQEWYEYDPEKFMEIGRERYKDYSNGLKPLAN